MKQLTATNNLTGMKIIQRYVDGVRYLKVVPKNVLPIILDNLKKQFVDQPIELEHSETGWIKIKKTGESEKLDKATEKLKEAGADSEDIDETYILNKEAEMLKKSGFDVKIEEIK